MDQEKLKEAYDNYRSAVLLMSEHMKVISEKPPITPYDFEYVHDYLNHFFDGIVRDSGLTIKKK